MQRPESVIGINPGIDSDYAEITFLIFLRRSVLKLFQLDPA